MVDHRWTDRPGLNIGQSSFTFRKAKKNTNKNCGNRNEQSISCEQVISCPLSLADYGINNKVMMNNCKAFEIHCMGALG
jgi:hypothetical protein